MAMKKWIRQFEDLGMNDVPVVGGKNASLGEMIRELSPLGVNVPGGFAVTAEAYRYFLRESGAEAKLRELLGDRERSVETLLANSQTIQGLLVAAELPPDLGAEIDDAYHAMAERYGREDLDVAVRSSATAEDLPTASFAGQQETYLNIRGVDALKTAVKRCFASLFTPRSINYREDMGFGHFDVALSVGVQKMVRSDLASSGVIFTLDTETGHRGFVMVTSSWGLGENVVQGKVTPDQFYVHKGTLAEGFRPVVWKKLGTKELRMVYAAEGREPTVNEPVADPDRRRFSLAEDDVLTLARWAVRIEEHYSKSRGSDSPMDLEWAKDGETGELFIVQARPETVHSQRTAGRFKVFHLKEQGSPLVTGAAIGDAIAQGKVRVIHSPEEIGRFQEGEVLVAVNTDPDWEPIMKKAAAIVTDHGGRTSHAAIVSRELGVPALVGTGNATSALRDEQEVTVSCAEGDTGNVYEGSLAFDTEEIDASTLPRPRTKIMLNVAQPDKAIGLSLLPSDGIGLARMEFVFSGWVGVHPKALLHPEDQPDNVRPEIERLTEGYSSGADYFVDKLAQGIGTLAAAFWPRPVILRFSDFKTNEYASLVGGAQYEPQEENPMLGWRGASRYYHKDYKEGFLLEVAAVKRVREVFGLTNLKVMIPFCRTPDEGGKVLAVMHEGGLVRGENGLEVYVMAEIPSNVLAADEFAMIFDGFSIGSNDLTQLVLGVDRDSATVAPLFDERNTAVKRACSMLLHTAHAAGRPVGICGQAPSDYPDFAAFLVEEGIQSISLNPDALIRTTREILRAEAGLDVEKPASDAMHTRPQGRGREESSRQGAEGERRT